MSIAHPIVCPSQMRHPLVCQYISDEVKAKIKASWYNENPKTEKEKAEMTGLLTLHDKLLSFGGEEVLMPSIEEDLEAILERGQFFHGDHVHMMPGEPSQCHHNASRMWDANRGRCQIATGYALSEDGLWRQHSWVVQPLTLSWRVWETTEKRIAYFGVVFNDDECEEFLYSNV